MPNAKSGDTVRVHYTGTLDDGTVFDSSAGRDPLQFELGSGQVIPGFDAAVIGLSAGERTTTQIPCDQAYGPRRDDMVLEASRDDLPPGLEPEVGQQLQLVTHSGQPVPVTISQVTDDAVFLDANHPLAGQDLTFEIELVDIQG